MIVTSLSVPHLPSDLFVYLALFSSVRNTKELRSQLLQGNADFEYAFIDADTILSAAHLLAAIFRAGLDTYHGRLRTRNVHSEIVYCLGYTNNITSTLTTFGISENTRNLIVVKISCKSLDLGSHANAQSISSWLEENVQGIAADVSGTKWQDVLEQYSDLPRICKIYKLGNAPDKQNKAMQRRRKDGSLEGQAAFRSAKNEPDGMLLSRTELEMQILGLMALRGAT